MRRRLAFLAVAVLAVIMLQPADSQASSQIEKIDKQLEKIRNDMNAISTSKNKWEGYMQTLIHRKDDTEASLQNLMLEIDKVDSRMSAVQDQLIEAEAALYKTGQELEEAEKRVKLRDELLQSRMRLMYMNGFVSYMDVLLSSTSFSDFVDRFDALKSILSQDREILDEHKRDRELIVQKKAEMEVQLANVENLYGKLKDYQMLLADKEEQRQVLLATYSQKIDNLSEFSKEQEEQLIKLARQVSELEKEKKDIRRREEEERRAREAAARAARAAQNSGSAAVKSLGGGALAVPIASGYRLSSDFGTRIHPVTGQRKHHAGIDLAAPEGTSIYAAESGTVIVAQKMSGYGNAVIIDHGGGMWTLYAHIRNGGIEVQQGDSVKRGQKIAEVGMTGTATGPHLHFEVRINEEPVNPTPYLQ
ncbi:peptidoglycan DD-metalloendopeptidase family protein [Paenibacillus cisolokensis]|uniref:murein hydrolase activator EnvC family protein n=1 Tax=Paenibacillus cisolokensis TaxID=1658519 RepID=UPI003D2E0CF5